MESKLMKISEDEFDGCVIAQDDDCDYSESGWVAVVKDGVAALANYSHCSCYGTFEVIDGKWDWTGSIPELIDMATRKADPSMPERTALKEDYDYDHLCRVYEEVLKWASRQENN